MAERSPLRKLGVTLLILAIAALQVADVLTTQHILATGGVELNPAMVLFVGDPALFWIVKGVLLVGIGICAHGARTVPRARRPVLTGLLAIGAWYVVVITNNALVLAGHGGLVCL